MPKICHIVILSLRGLALFIVLGLSALFLLGAWTMHAQGIKILGVQSGSMVPALNVGDAVLVRPSNFNHLSVGQVVSYHSNGSMIISHRIRSINYRQGTLVTQGDHNPQPDGTIRAAQIMGLVTQTMPQLGRLTDLLRQPLGLLAIVYLPATVCIVWQLRLMQVKLKPTYRLQSQRKRGSSAV